MRIVDSTDEIVRKRVSGMTLDAIAAEYGCTREWIRKVLITAGAPSATDIRRQRAERARAERQRAEEALRQQAVAFIRQRPNSTTVEVGEALGVTGSRVIALVRGLPEALLVRHTSGTISAADDDTVFAALREVCSEVDGVCTLTKYNAARRGRGVSGARIIQRYGKWATALDWAGVPNQGKRNPVGHHRSDRITEDALLDAVSQFWEETGEITAHAYERWAMQGNGPSLSLVVQRFGGWGGMKTALAARSSAYRSRADAGEDARRPTTDPTVAGSRERPGE